jgi:4-hydroxy-3-polyprenylbenzoate decarboxylase
LHAGSKLVIAAAGPTIRTLSANIDERIRLPGNLGVKNPRVFMPGVLVLEALTHSEGHATALEKFAAFYDRNDPINSFPLIVLVDSSEFATRSTENFLWTVFTKSNPATDVLGIEAFTVDKHWGCRGSLVIDARSKPHHAPPLVEDPDVTARVDALAARGGPLHGII